MESKSYIVPGSKKEGQTHVLRNHACEKSLEIKFLSEVQTVHDIFWYSVKTQPRAPYLGHRPYDPINDAFYPYKFETYEEIAVRVANVGSGIISIKLKEGEKDGKSEKSGKSGKDSKNIKKNARRWPVGIYSINRPEWTIVDRAAISQSLYTVPLYDSANESALEHIINHAEITIVFCSLDKVSKLLRIRDKLPKLKTIVSMDSFDLENGGLDLPSPFNINAIKVLKAWAASTRVRLYDFKQIERIGEKKFIAMKPPKKDDIYTICYTSGTTGRPKGVISTHSAYVNAAKNAILAGASAEGQTKFFMSYLPLAHCFNRNFENVMTLNSGAIGYYCGDVYKLIDDCQALQPHAFAAVPSILNRIYDKISEATINAPGIRGAVFRKGFSVKLHNLKSGKGNIHPIWDTLLFNKVKGAISKNLELVVSGGAPLAPHVMDLLRTMLCCTVVEGFGMTETSSSAFVQERNENTSGNIGVPSIGVEAKLIDVSEMGYTSEDKPCPRGELCIRGEVLFSGYYKEPEKTTKPFLDDGWFATGDVARINADGTVSIIDRKKNIFKLSQGEYVAPEKIENVLTTCNMVFQVFVYGDSLQNHLVAIAVPFPEAFLPWAQSIVGSKTQPCSLEELCTDPSVAKALLEILEKVSDQEKLLRFEKVKAIHLEPIPFTIENGLLTPTMKLKRKAVLERFSSVIEKLYK
ncbi:Long chain acyl-CoA synthetase 7, peroxisomal [Zancudomyces culisetae]|uniref:Long chain acyl-CoA synthetase 7, peroxisomal n=1 Tax=Zancudomyces culisetae TaxID=1213189 RepID=A0A1R1PPH8_ZANCU|nr:Long chain acyl-CoA synthetase 7, peroxisomal [Zancudomyces culisetae]|eukprot:OMH82859.1 Long chain acyl-CoA synthetase 7, peroxisomal [Zancudomyces culisetae]